MKICFSECGSDNEMFPAHVVLPLDVSKRIETLEEQFDSLHDRLVTELSEGCASVTKILQALTKLPIRLRNEYEIRIQNMLPDLEKREVIDNLFLRLNPLFTFIDFKLLHHLISKFGSQELKTDMATYADKVQLFKKVTTISDLIDYWPGPKELLIDHNMLRTKLEADPKSYTLEKLDLFRNRFFNELRLSEIVSASILVLLENANSFVAMWFVPTVVVPELIEAFSQLDSTFLQIEQVVELSLKFNKKTLYQRNIPSSNMMTSSIMTPPPVYTHVSVHALKRSDHMHKG